MKKICVMGAGGAIGGHLVKKLLEEPGTYVRAIDIKPKKDWWQLHHNAENIGSTDLSNYDNARRSVEGADQVYDLAEVMGGIGFITTHKVNCAESIEIGIALLRACVAAKVPRFFFSSSACVYNTSLQATNFHQIDLIDDVIVPSKGTAPQLKESDAWPAQPEEGYGFSKLYMEELCKHYSEEKGLEVRIARFHNIFGEHGTWNDGKEKAPAAMCRKVAQSVLSDHEIEIWGDGNQLRSYLHVDDCVRGTIMLMESDYDKPLNIGSDRSVTINQLVDIIETIAYHKTGILKRNYIPGAIGVDARNADLTLVKSVLGWEPKNSLEYGLAMLYTWIEQEISNGASRART